MAAEKTFEVHGVPLTGIKNRNERRVAKVLDRVLVEMAEEYNPDHLDVQDIYALTLNLLPSRYVQRASIVLQEPVKEVQIEAAIRRALKIVRARPNH